jgi:hypothetical protein
MGTEKPTLVDAGGQNSIFSQLQELRGNRLKATSCLTFSGKRQELHVLIYLGQMQNQLN